MGMCRIRPIAGKPLIDGRGRRFALDAMDLWTYKEADGGMVT